MQTVKSVKRRSTTGITSTAHHETRSAARRGFTLVELMVVITVIAVLVAVLGVTLSHMGQQAKEAATNATIKKIHVLLEQRLEAFARAMDKAERNPDRDQDYQDAFAAVDAELRQASVYIQKGSPQAKILVRKWLKKKNFPQAIADVDFNTNGIPDEVELDSTVTFDPAKHALKPDTESSELLYYALTRSVVGGAPPVDAGEFLASEVGDTDGDGLIEFIDAWGNPLRFYRWPTRLFKSDGTNHTEAPANPNDHAIVNLLIKGTNDTQVDTDPDDPVELLTAIIRALPETSSASSPEPDSFEDLYHAPYTYHLPLVVSAGPDGELGLFEPNDKPNFGTWARADSSNLDALTDNITNRNQRSGD